MGFKSILFAMQTSGVVPGYPNAQVNHGGEADHNFTTVVINLPLKW